jgi:hypothetical protein
MACRGRNDLAGAADAASRAFALNSTAAQAMSLSFLVACGQGDTETTLARCRDLMRAPPHNPRWALEHARLLTLLGRVMDAARETPSKRSRAGRPT